MICVKRGMRCRNIFMREKGRYMREGETSGNAKYGGDGSERYGNCIRWIEFQREMI